MCFLITTGGTCPKLGIRIRKVEQVVLRFMKVDHRLPPHSSDVHDLCLRGKHQGAMQELIDSLTFCSPSGIVYLIAAWPYGLPMSVKQPMSTAHAFPATASEETC